MKPNKCKLGLGKLTLVFYHESLHFCMQYGYAQGLWSGFGVQLPACGLCKPWASPFATLSLSFLN